MKYKITVVSDTHTKHKEITNDLPGGDILLHSGDISSRGYLAEIKDFFEWFESLKNYEHKIFIAGNHDWGFVDSAEHIKELQEMYPGVTYLQDDFVYIVGDDYKTPLKIYGSPWQPRFYDWAFNADRGEDIKQHWDKIPDDTDILLTHGPAHGFLDKVHGRGPNLGCEELAKAIGRVNPKIHLCGHIHSANGYTKYNDIHFFNASVLNESYLYTYTPNTFEWDQLTNEINFIS
jgi:Icc-related predicted phosphoesterase